jgi:hypothetical protein
MTVSDVAGWKKFALFSCGGRQGVPYLNYEILWTPMLTGRLASHAWLDDTQWRQFVEQAEIGDVFNGKGVIVVVRLKATAEDYEE